MATVQKTSLKRYNGIDWDPVYLTTSADITYLGTAITANPGAGFDKGVAITASTSVAELLTTIIQNLVKINSDEIPAIKDGTALENIPAANITGMVERDNLPVDVSGKTISVTNDDERKALTYTQVNPGDLVTVNDLNTWSVLTSTPTEVTMKELHMATLVTQLEWNKVTQTPSTLIGYGIVDAATADDMTLAKTDIMNLKNGSAIEALNVSKLSGLIPATKLGADATQHTYEFTSLSTAITALMSDDGTTYPLSLGDIIITGATDGGVYRINSTDRTTFDTATVTAFRKIGYMATIPYTAIGNLPTTLAGFGITDAVASSMVVTEANATNVGKLLVLNADGKLDVSITGDAATLGGNASEFYAKQTDLTTTNENVSTLTTRVNEISGTADIDASRVTSGVFDLARIPKAAIENVHPVANHAAMLALTITDIQSGDSVKVLDDDGKGTVQLYVVTDDTKLGTEDAFISYAVGAAASVAWSGVNDKPTTLAGFGITDAVAKTEIVTIAIAANAGKLLALNADGKLDVDITGAVSWDKVDGRPSSTKAQIDNAVASSFHANRVVLDKIADSNGTLTYNGTNMATADAVTALSGGILTVLADANLPADAAVGAMCLEPLV